MAKNWDAVARAITTRMEQLEVTQTEVARRADVSLQTFRELQQNLAPRKRTARTLAAVSAALDLPDDYLSEVLEGRDPDEPVDPNESDPVLAELAALKDRMDAMDRRLERLEQQRAAYDEPSSVD